jgi:hypothetical protein
MPLGKARGQQPSTVRAGDETLESSFDRPVTADLGAAQLVLGMDGEP